MSQSLSVSHHPHSESLTTAPTVIAKVQVKTKEAKLFFAEADVAAGESSRAW